MLHHYDHRATVSPEFTSDRPSAVDHIFRQIPPDIGRQTLPWIEPLVASIGLSKAIATAKKRKG